MLGDQALTRVLWGGLAAFAVLRGMIAKAVAADATDSTAACRRTDAFMGDIVFSALPVVRGLIGNRAA
jgi:hypothetical protein